MYNESNYNYNFIINELAEEIEKQCPCWGKNTEKCITFTVLIEKEDTRIQKSREEITKNYDSTRSMTGLLSNLVNNLSEGIHKTECKYGHDDKTCKTCIVK